MFLTKNISNLNIRINKNIKILKIWKSTYPLSIPLSKLDGSRSFRGDWTKGFTVIDSIIKCDEDIRSDIFKSIVLAGGTTLFAGFKERVLNELNQLYSSSYRIRVLNPSERKFSTWIGWSILASLSVFEDKWITKSEYDEHGPRIVQQKWL